MNLLYNCVKRFESRDSEGNEKNVSFTGDLDDSRDKMKRNSKLDDTLSHSQSVNKTDHVAKTKAWNSKVEDVGGSRHSKLSSKTIIRTTRKSADYECICPHQTIDECPEGCPNSVTAYGIDRNRGQSLSSMTQTSS